MYLDVDRLHFQNLFIVEQSRAEQSRDKKRKEKIR
jgi:hypothetical protein